MAIDNVRLVAIDKVRFIGYFIMIDNVRFIGYFIMINCTYRSTEDNCGDYKYLKLVNELMRIAQESKKGFSFLLLGLMLPLMLSNVTLQQESLEKHA